MAGKPDMVEKAVQLLERSEILQGHGERARQIKKAFVLLNAYLDENPGSEYREYIENCKRAYIRSHLKRLSVLEEPDRETFFFNFILFLTADCEVDQVLEQQPELKSWYDRFGESYQERPFKEFMPLLKRTRSKH